jgi:hypothetical protein
MYFKCASFKVYPGIDMILVIPEVNMRTVFYLRNQAVPGIETSASLKGPGRAGTVV